MIKQPLLITLIDLTIFQAIWWLGVLVGQAALLSLVLLLCLHLVLINQHLQRDLLALLVLAPLGWMLDLSLQAWGFWSLQTTLPFWLLMIWAGFILSLFYSLAWLAKLPIFIQSLIGGIGGALSYLAGFKLGAISFIYPVLNTSLGLFFIWALFLPLLILGLDLFESSDD